MVCVVLYHNIRYITNLVYNINTLLLRKRKEKKKKSITLRLDDKRVVFVPSCYCYLTKVVLPAIIELYFYNLYTRVIKLLPREKTRKKRKEKWWP